jgi:hypothetical protein
MTSADDRQHAHELIDRMASGQVTTVVGLLEIMLDPLARTLASAPYDDEPVSEKEACEVENPRSRAGLQRRRRESPDKRTARRQ